MLQDLKTHIAADTRGKMLLTGFLEEEKSKLVKALVDTADYEQSARLKGAIAEIDTIIGKVIK